MKRRRFLQATGCTLALPALESFGQDSGAGESAKAKRMLLFCLGQGFYTEPMYPTAQGHDYEMSEILKPLKRHRDKFTMLGGLQNSPDAKINHHGGQPFAFTGYSKGTGKLKDSLDQFVAKKIGNKTRVAVVSSGRASFKDGLPVSGAPTPRSFFDTLFGKIDKKKEAEMIAYRKSVIDYVRGDAKRLEQQVTAADRAKLDEYFESVRQAQASLAKKEAWLNKPQVQIDYPTAKAVEIDKNLSKEEQKWLAMKNTQSSIELQEQLSMVHLAFKHDVTRVACIYLPSPNYGYHGLTHAMGNGGAPGLTAWATFYMDMFSNLFDKFKAAEMPAGNTLMDETITIMTTTLGMNRQIGSHSSRDIPMVLAGGGFNHGAYHFLRSEVSPCNVYVTAMQQMGIKVDRFANSTGSFDV